MVDELKDQRIVTMMTPSEVKGIDDWAFAHRIRSRGDAMRRLCQMGMAAEAAVPAIHSMAVRKSQEATNALNATDGVHWKDAAIVGGRSLLELLKGLSSLTLVLYATLGEDTEKSLELSRDLKEHLASLDLSTPEGAKRLSELLGALAGPDDSAS